MKAVSVAEHGGPEVLDYRHAPDPAPGPGQVVINVKATSVNFADIKARIGNYKGQAPPFIPGLDAAGVIESIGEGVFDLVPGQRVAAYTSGGSYAELALADAATTYPLPDELSFEQGAAVGIGITAYNVLTLAGRLEPGESVLIHAGAGGVGSLAIQLARILEAGSIFATASSQDKLDFATSCGADLAINYREADFAEGVLSHTGGQGVDLILDSIAGATSERGMSCLAEFGRLVVYGHTGAGPGRFDTSQLHNQNRGVIGYSSGGFRKSRPQRLRPAAEAVFKHISAGRLEAHIGARFALADAAAAHQLVETRRSLGKVLLLP